jgi:hypothetical protein
VITNGVSITSQADITGTPTEWPCNVITNNSTGILTISSGTILQTGANGFAIAKVGNGDVFINGGTVEATGEKGKAIGFMVPVSGSGMIRIEGNSVIRSKNVVALPVAPDEAGTIAIMGSSADPRNRLYICGGTIENTANTGVAVSNNSNHEVLIAGGTISSAGGAVGNFSTGTVTIWDGSTISARLAGVGNMSTGKLDIIGGVISSETFFAVGNALAGVVDISGGMFLAKEGYALNNLTTGTVTVTGGIGFAYGAAATDVVSGVVNVPTPTDAVLVAWNRAESTYDADTSDDIFKFPSEATAVWAKQGSNSGILVTHGTTTGFIPVEGVTVTGVGIAEAHGSAAIQVFPNPTTGELRITCERVDKWTSERVDNWTSEEVDKLQIFDIYGRNVGIKFPFNFLKVQTEQGVVMKKVVKQ